MRNNNHMDDSDFDQVIIYGQGKYKIAVLDITGTIVSHENSSSPKGKTKTQTYACDFVEMATIAAEDPSIAGVILRINSPGGEAGASEDIHDAILQIAAKKPIVTFVENVCASGAYMAAVGSHYIAAPPSALVGSIGVIMQHIEISAALKKFGIKANILTTGKFKGACSMYEPMSPEVEDYIREEILNETFNRFKDIVFSCRKNKIASEDTDEITSGKVFSAPKAERLGLIDQIVKSNLQTQVAFITKVVRNNCPELADEEFAIIEFRPKISFWDMIRGNLSQIKLNPLARINALIDSHSTPGLWYMWLP